MSGECGADDPALLTALPLHQHVALQPFGAGTPSTVVHPTVGAEAASKVEPHRAMG